eukprot:scaffold29396_cov51-Isochrysis_galbana.AAC.1
MKTYPIPTPSYFNAHEDIRLAGVTMQVNKHGQWLRGVCAEEQLLEGVDGRVQAGGGTEPAPVEIDSS